MEVRACLHCQERLRGRSDKKFCDYLCRSAYYNEIHGKTNNHIRRINRILKQNRRILEQFTNEQNLSKVSATRLNDLGFNFGYHTYTIAKENKTYFFCYEFGYVHLENNYFAVIFNQE